MQYPEPACETLYLFRRVNLEERIECAFVLYRARHEVRIDGVEHAPDQSITGNGHPERDAGLLLECGNTHESMSKWAFRHAGQIYFDS